MEQATKIRVAQKMVGNGFIYMDPLRGDASSLPRLPMVFIVNERVYLTYYAAVRASYNTVHPVEVYTIDEAVNDLREFGKMAISIDALRVRWGANVLGELYMGRFLFSDRDLDAEYYQPQVVCGLSEDNKNWPLYNRHIMGKIKECRLHDAHPPVFKL